MPPPSFYINPSVSVSQKFILEIIASRDIACLITKVYFKIKDPTPNIFIKLSGQKNNPLWIWR